MISTTGFILANFTTVFSDVGSAIWQLILGSLAMVSTLNTIIFTSFVELPFIGSVSIFTLMFNPITFGIIFANMVRKKLV